METFAKILSNLFWGLVLLAAWAFLGVLGFFAVVIVSIRLLPDGIWYIGQLIGLCFLILYICLPKLLTKRN